jgi:hypothetical protein
MCVCEMVCQQPRFGREGGDFDLLVYAKTGRFKLKGGKELTMYNRAKFYSPTSKRKVGWIYGLSHVGRGSAACGEVT